MTCKHICFCIITAVELQIFLARWQSLRLVQERTWHWKHRRRRLNNALFYIVARWFLSLQSSSESVWRKSLCDTFLMPNSFLVKLLSVDSVILVSQKQFFLLSLCVKMLSAGKYLAVLSPDTHVSLCHWSTDVWLTPPVLCVYVCLSVTPSPQIDSIWAMMFVWR